ncbi:hypothetical protein LAJ19_08905 [Deinococcus taeanensis]|uniref:hypothetical protein n=1 Tax=Deinococcus taeanensis TaxID=2737050 RepID=UPI001CDB82FB|nr:hypothetical protein [Deinococcus taeanensis]UBV41770.1 hypothetical protein LAJ19_08905 [Deinococcus taeanensis]
MRLTLQTTPSAEDALNATRQTVGRLTNALLVHARRTPETPCEDLLPGHPDAQRLPQGTRRAVALAAQQARRRQRGGVKGESYWLDARSLRIDARTGHVTLWTLSGRLTLPARLGNYQRHLLTRGRIRGGRVTLSRAGEWYINVDLSLPDRPAPRSIAPRPHPLDARVDQLEREGRYAELAPLLQDRPLDSRQTGQLALALLETGETDAAELRLLAATASPRPDARIHLGLSLLAAMRSGPAARLAHAQRGLGASPDDITRWWLCCSQARALVELGDAREAQALMAAVLDEIPVSELRSRARALYFAQNVSASLDDFASQDRYAREALRLFDLLGGHSEGLSLRLDLGYRLYFQGRPEESFSMIAEVLRRAEQVKDHRRDTAHLICGELCLLDEQFERALAHLNLALDTQQRQGSDRLNVPARAFRAECLWRLGQLDWGGFERQIEALRPAQEFDHVTRAFYLGLIAFELGELSAAEAAFRQVTEGVALLDGFRLRSHAFLAYCRWAAGQALEDACAELLGVLTHVGGELALAVDASRLASLYTACAAQGLGGGAARRLARRARPVVHVRLLGEFGLQVGETAAHVRLRKARELLAFLAVRGPATRDQLITALWDGEGRPELRSYFKQALHALREALRPLVAPGTDPVPLMGGSYRLSDRFAVQCDAVEIKGASPTLTPAQGERLLELYTGPFMPELDTQWVNEERENLESRMLSMMMSLGQAAEAHDPAAAAALYLKAAQINPLFESAWTSAVRAYEHAALPHLALHARMTQKRVLDNELLS